MNKEPTDAATVVLLSNRSSGGCEIFLMKRVKSSTYREEIYVFPGGLLEEADLDPELEGCAGEFSGVKAKRLLQEPDISESLALGLFMAAIRETFEEAGVLLARDSSGGVVDLLEPDAASRFAGYRREVYQRRLSLSELARREKLVFAPDLLVPYSHWITPEIVPRRFNARIFLTFLPASQKPEHDNLELTDSCWLTPVRAIAAYSARRMFMMPPTIRTIEELNESPDAEELLTTSRSRKIEVILPEAFRTAEGLKVRLPDGREYFPAPKSLEAN
ncbi:MAG: NUDIX hydrolase [Syntrophales bacterium]